MPEMIALKSFRVSETGEFVQPGGMFTCSDGAARVYENRDRAVLSGGAPLKPIKNKAAETGPFGSRGGVIGEAEPPRLSPPDRPRRGRPPNASKVVRE
jgi:hypothetical protein